jgi:hypothetical protein
VVIDTKVIISKEEVYKLIKDHMRNVHKLDVDELTMKSSNNKFNGFDLTIMRIETSMEEIHESTPTFEPEKEKKMI